MKIIQFYSPTVYCPESIGASLNYSCLEFDVTEDLPLVPLSVYNKTKMISEQVLLSYKNEITLKIIRPATVCGYSPRMRLDLSVNMLTMQALLNNTITVFGGKQTRPNIYIKDMVGVYIHFLELHDKGFGIYNAGFENITILDIAKKVTEYIHQLMKSEYIQKKAKAKAKLKSVKKDNQTDQKLLEDTKLKIEKNI